MKLKISRLSISRELLIFLPAIFAFLLALIPTMKYNWPLSWDIYYHIHNSCLYKSGMVFWDTSTAAPYGRPIFYPPLFHLLLLGLDKILAVGLFNVARFIQPFLAFFIILSFSYTAKKFYGNIPGILTGFFVISAPLFQRMILPIPESMAIILLPLLTYFYYLSIEENNSKYAIIAGVLWGLVMLTHLPSALVIFLILTIATIILRIRGNENMKYYWILLFAGLIVSAIWFIPLSMKYGFVFKSPPPQPLPFRNYMQLLGPIPFFLALIAFIYILRRGEDRDVILISWFLTVIFLSMAYIIGIKVITERVIYFDLFPVGVLAGITITLIDFGKYKKSFHAITLIIIILSVYSGFNTINQIQPAISDSQIGVAEWFKNNGDHKRVVVTADYRIDPIIVSISGQPVAAGGYAPGTVKSINGEKYISGNFNKDDILKENIGYIVLKAKMPPPPYGRLVYQNKDFRVYELVKG